MKLVCESCFCKRDFATVWYKNVQSRTDLSDWVNHACCFPVLLKFSCSGGKYFLDGTLDYVVSVPVWCIYMCFPLRLADNQPVSSFSVSILASSFVNTRVLAGVAISATPVLQRWEPVCCCFLDSPCTLETTTRGTGAVFHEIPSNTAGNR